MMDRRHFLLGTGAAAAALACTPAKSMAGDLAGDVHFAGGVLAAESLAPVDA